MARKRRRLNVKFLVILVSVVGALLLGGLLAGWWYKQSPERAVARATAAEAEGDWELAAEQWAKAARAAGNNREYHLNAINAAMHLTGRENGREWLGRINQNYTALIAADPTMLPALRGQMRLLAGDRGFNAPVATTVTREVRRLAGEVLKQDPGDVEAQALRAIATLNLAQFTGEGVTPADVEQAKSELRAAVAADPVAGGQAVYALANRVLAEADQARMRGETEAALAAWQETVAMLDQVAARHGQPAAAPSLQVARLQWRLGQAYMLAARVKPLFDAAHLVRSGTPPQQVDLRRLAEDAPAREADEKSRQHLAAARQALDDARDVLEEDYYLIRSAWAESLLQQEKFDEAIAELRSMAAARPWDAQAAGALARLLQSRGAVEEALATMRDFYAREGEPLPPLVGHAGANARINRLLHRPLLADLLLARREQVQDPAQRDAIYAEAKAVLEQYEGQRKAAGFGESAEPARLAGQMQMIDGNVSGGLETLTSALRFTEGAQGQAERRERLRTLALLVEANQRLGQTGAQQRYLEEMVRMAPASAPLRRELAQLYLVQGDRERARELIDQLLEQDPTNPTYQQLSLQATPPDQQEGVYAQMPEDTPEQRRSKLAAALRLAKREEAIRLAQAVQSDLPAQEQRTPQQQRQHEGLTLLQAQELARLDRKQEAIALLEPLAASNETAQRLVTQYSQGTDALIQSLPEGPGRLLLESQLAERRGDQEAALAKLQEGHLAAPENPEIANRLFGAYLLRGMFDAAEEIAGPLRTAGADAMGGQSYDVRLAIVRGEADVVQRATALANAYPQLAEAQALLGEAHRVAGQSDDAVESYRRALELAPNDVGSLSGMILALQGARRGQEARPYIDAGLRVQPDSPQFRAADRNYQLQYGDPTQVIAQRREAVEQNPDDPEAHLELGQTLSLAAAAAREREGAEAQEAQYLADALAALLAALERFPKETRFLQALVSVAVDAGEPAMAAIEPAVAAAVIGPEAPLGGDPAAVAVAADYYSRRENHQQAESVVRAALGRNEELTREQRASLLMVLSFLLAQQERIDDAVAVLGGFEDYPVVLGRKVELLAARSAENPQDAQAYQAARAASDAAVEQKTLPIGGLNALAYAEIRRGDFERAQQLLEQSLAQQPNNARTIFFRAAAEARRPGGSLDRAAELLEQARRLRPDDTETLRELARVQMQRGSQDEAVAALAQLAELDPKDVGARLDVINLLLGLNPPRIAEAGRQFREAERAGTAEDPQLLMARSRMERVRGRTEDALVYGRQAVQRALGTPHELPALQAYLSMLLRAQRYQDVLAGTQAVLNFPGGPPWWVLRARGEALARLGRRDEAATAYAQAFERAEQAPGGSGSGSTVLVDMSQRLGFNAAFALIRDRVEPADGSTPDVRYLMLASNLYANGGQVERAVALLEQAREQARQAPAPSEGQPAPPGALAPAQTAALEAQLGALYMQSTPRRLEEAIASFRRVLEGFPQNLGALNNLAYALTLQGEDLEGEAAITRLDEAVAVGRRAYDLAVQAAQRAGEEANPAVVDTYGWALAVRGIAGNDRARMQEALRLLREGRASAERGEERFVDLYLHLSLLQHALQDGPAAQEAAEAGLAVVDQLRRDGLVVDELTATRLQQALDDARRLVDEQERQRREGAQPDPAQGGPPADGSPPPTGG